MLTILAGSNASGKSSLIQSLLILNTAININGKKKLSSSDIFGINLGLPENIISSEHSSNYVHISVVNDKGYSASVKLGLYKSEENPTSFAIEEIRSEDLCKEINKLAYLNAERYGPRITNTLYDHSELSVGNHGENTNYVISSIDKNLRNLGLMIPDQLNISKIQRFSAICEEWLGVIIPDTKINIRTEVEYNLSNIRISNNGEFYVPTATGFGITYVLPIIVQGLIQSMYEGSVFIVENPEAHLHPFSQSQIGKFLAFLSQNGVQVIVETHSEHVVNGCRIEYSNEKSDSMRVLYFQKKLGEIEVDDITVDKFGELTHWPEGFFDQSKKDLRKILENRLCKK
jgi:predicted ATPase